MNPIVGTGPVLEVASRTDPGLRRAVNEDALIADDPFYLVADGMGGHEAGDAASRAAIGVFEAALGRPVSLASIENVIEQARRAVEQVARGTSRGAGCTLSGVVRFEHEGAPYWYVLNVGDSRVYLHRGAELTRLTADHSLRDELEAVGHADARAMPRNVITRALGAEDSRHDAWLLPVQTGARMLVCSDGLTNELSDEELLAVLTVGGRPESVAEELLRRACDAGGRDNISLIVIDTLSGGAASDAEPDNTGAQRWDSSTVATLSDETLERTRPGNRT